MASTTQNDLLETFTEAAGGLTQNLDTMASAGDELASTGSVAKPKSSEAEQGTAQASSSSASSNTNSGSAGSEALSIATTVLESGLGIVPLVAGLIGLFTGGGDSSAPPPLVKYAMPQKMQFEGADTGNAMSDADYDQMGTPRTYSGSPNGSPSASVTAPASSGGGGSTSAAPQIQVNVQAMDAQSFMDHSNEIAQAVRSAMLNLSSINDVVSDL